jgi:uncharacterized damage-inducible protein DinB
MSLATISRIFDIHHRALAVNLDGITDDEALIEPHPGGNCINWIVGHILISRDAILGMLGQQPVFNSDRAVPYKRGAKVEDVGKLVPLSELLEALGATQKKLMTALEKLPEAEANKPLEPAGSDPKTALIDQLAFLQFHEGYHIGQVGLLRRIVGKEGAIQ